MSDKKIYKSFEEFCKKSVYIPEPRQIWEAATESKDAEVDLLKSEINRNVNDLKLCAEKIEMVEKENRRLKSFIENQRKATIEIAISKIETGAKLKQANENIKKLRSVYNCNLNTACKKHLQQCLCD